MSKKINNSRKNNNNTASKSKKNSKKNFKIENLEPRLMMSADPVEPQLDFGQIESYTEQFKNVSKMVGQESSDFLGKNENFDIANFGIVEASNSIFGLVGETADSFKSSLTNKVGAIFENAVKKLETDVQEKGEKISEYKIKLNDFVETYVKQAISDANDKNLIASVDENSNLVFGYSLNFKKSAKDLGIAISQNQVVELTGENAFVDSELSLKLTLSLDQGKNGVILDQNDDVGVSISIENLKVSVNNLDMKVKFMNMELEEIDISDETEDDLNLSYSTASGEYTHQVDLEFKFTASEGLPFAFAEDGILKITTDDNNNWNIDFPEVQLKDEYSMAGLLSTISNGSESLLKGVEFPFNNSNYKIDEIIQSVNSTWTKASVALQGAIENVNGNLQLNAEKLAVLLESLIGDKQEDLKNIVSSIGIKAKSSVYEPSLFYDAGKAFNQTFDSELKALSDGEQTFTLVITPNIGKLDSFDFYSHEFKNLDVDFSIAIDVTVTENNGVISISKIDLNDVAIELTGLSSQLPEALPFALDGDSIILSIDSSAADAKAWSVEMPEVSMKNLSLSSVVGAVSNVDIPFLRNTKLPFGNKNLSINEISNQLNTYWSALSFVMENSIEKKQDDVGTTIQLKMDQLKDQFVEIIGDKKADLNSLLASLKVRTKKILDDGSTVLGDAFDILNGTSVNQIMGLEQGSNNLVFEFDSNMGILDSLNLGAFSLKSVNASTSVSICVEIDVDENGCITFNGITLDRFNVKINKNGINESVSFGSFEAALTNGSLDFDVSVNSDFNVSNCDIELKYESIQLASGIGLKTGDSFSYDFVSKEWALPESFTDLTAVFNTESFSVKTLLNAIQLDSVPFLGKTTLSFGSTEYSISEFAGAVDDIWTSANVALSAATQAVGETLQMNVKELAADFAKLLQNYSAESILKNVHLKFFDADGVSQDIDLLKNDYAENLLINLPTSETSFTLEFKPDGGSFDNVSVLSTDLGMVSVDTHVAIDFKICVGESGSARFVSAGLNSLSFELNIDDSLKAKLPFTLESKLSATLKEDDSSQWEWIFDGLDKINFNLDSVFNFATYFANDIPLLGSAKMNFGNVEYTVVELATNVNSVWQNAYKALKSSIEKVDNVANTIKIDLSKLKDAFNSYIDSAKINISEWLSNLNVVVDGKSYNLLKLSDSSAETLLIASGDSLEFEFTPFDAELNDSINLFSKELSGLKVSASFSAKIQTSLNPDNTISLATSIGDVSLSMDVSSNDVIKSLPFSIESGEIKVFVENGVLGYTIPEFKINKDEISLSNLITALENYTIPYLNDVSMPIMGNSTVLEVAQKLDRCWNAISSAFYLENIFEIKDSSIIFNQEKLNHVLDSIVKNNDLKAILKTMYLEVNHVKDDGTSEVVNLKLFGEDNPSQYTLDGKSGSFNLVFKQEKQDCCDQRFGIFKDALKDLKFDFEISVQIDYSVDENSFQLSRVSLQNFDVCLEHHSDSSVDIGLGSFNAQVENENFKFELSVNSDFKPSVRTIELSYNRATMKVGGLLDISLPCCSITYDPQSGWSIPSNFTNSVELYAKKAAVESVLNTLESYEIPYLSDVEFGLDGDQCTLVELIKKVQDNWNDVFNVLFESVVCGGGSNQLNLTELAKACKSKKLDSVLTRLFSTIKIGENNILDIFANGEDSNDVFVSLSTNDPISFIFVPKLGNIDITILGQKFKTPVELSFATKIDVSKDDDGAFYFSDVKLDYICLELSDVTPDSTKDLPFSVNSDDSCFKVELGKNGFISNIEANESFSVVDSLFSLANSIDFRTIVGSVVDNFSNIPFIGEKSLDFTIGNTKYNLKSIADNLLDYWDLFSSAMGGQGVFVESSDVVNFNLDKLRTLFGSYNSGTSSKFLNIIRIVDSSSNEYDITGTTSLNAISLSEGEHKFVLTLIPQKGLFDNIDLGIFKLNGLNLDVALSLNFSINVTKNSGKFNVQLDNLSVKDCSLEIKKDIGSIHLGLVELNLLNGLFDLKFKVDCDSSTSSVNCNAVVGVFYDTLTANSGNITLYEDTSNQQKSISYNSETKEWTLPNDLKRFTTLSSENLVNQVYVYLNSLQTALHSLVENNAKFDFLDGSIDKVVDVANQIEKVVYGNSQELQEAGNYNENDVFGLYKYVDGRYEARFDDIEEFITIFNSAWKKFVFDGNDDVCSLKKSDKDNHTATIKFDLKFGKSKDFDLNFANALAKAYDGLEIANVSTTGCVNVSADASFGFSVTLDFSAQVISDSTSLDKVVKDSLLDGLKKKQQYTEYVINDDALYVNEKFEFKIKSVDGSSTIDSVSVKNGDLNSSSFALEKNDVTVGYTPENLIYITANQKFKIESDTPSQLTELKLSDSTLQTFANVSVDADNNATVYIKGSSSDSIKISIAKIESLCDDGIITSSNWIDRLNEYLSLQKHEGFDYGIGDYVAIGRSISNTFGIYVLDVDKDSSDVLTAIKFGCDTRRIQNYETNPVEYEICKSNSENVTYMLVSGEISGNGLDSNKISYTKKLLISYENPFDSSTSVQTWENVVYGSENAAKVAANNWINNNASSQIGKFFKAVDCKVTLDDSSIEYQVQIVPIDWYEDNFDFVHDDFKRNADSYDNDLIENANKAQTALSKAKAELNEYLDKNSYCLGTLSDGTKVYPYDIDLVDCGNGTYQLMMKLSDDVDKITHTTTLSEGFIEVKVENLKTGNTQKVLVDISASSSLSSVANAIEKAIKRDGLDTSVLSVSVEETSTERKIVFTTVDGVSISTDAFKSNSTETYFDGFRVGDTVVNFYEDVLSKIQKDNPNDGLNDAIEKTNIEKFVSYLNDSLENSATVNFKCKDGNNQYLDHLEIVGSSFFKISGIGKCNVLQSLGFSDGAAEKDSSGQYKIVGTALLDVDWTKAFSLDNLNLSVDLGVSINPKIDVCDVSSTSNGVKLALEKGSLNQQYCVGGFVSVVDGSSTKWFQIIEIGDDYLVISKSDYLGENSFNYNENDLKDNINYIANASASLGFIGMDVLACGDFKITAKLNFEKSTDSEDETVLGYKITPTIGPDSTSSQNGFTFNAYADVCGSKTKLATGSLTVESDNNSSYSVKTNLTPETNVAQIIDQFKNFSIEQLFSVLEGLVDKIASLTKRTDVKIPVINKSIGDLVNVAEYLSNVITEMRALKIYSMQQFVSVLNERLSNFDISAYGKNQKMVELSYDDSAKTFAFAFHLYKNFNTSHRFNFGCESSGINGNINLEVSGGFWIDLSAKLCTSGDFDLILNKPIDFGADVEISGDKLSFNLGIDGLGSDILKNLIAVGANGENAFIYGKTCLNGTFGESTNSLTETVFSNFAYDLKMALFGKLPVTVCNVSLGDVLLGVWNGSSVQFDVNDITTCKTRVKAALEKGSGAPGVYVLNNGNKAKFNLFYDENSKPQTTDGSTVLVADLHKVYDQIQQYANFSNLDWFEKIKLAVSALNNLFETLESGINSNLANSVKSVPVVGSALSSGVDFLSTLKNKVLDPFSKFVYESTGLSAELVAQKMYDLFGDVIRNGADLDSSTFTWAQTTKSSNKATDWESIESSGVWYRSSSNSAEWFFQLGGTYDFGSSLGFDFGFPGLGLEADGGLSLSLDWSLDFGFGISAEDGFYFIFNDGDEINVTAEASLSANILGALAGLGLSLDTKSDNSYRGMVDIGFGVNLSDSGTEIGKETLSADKKRSLRKINFTDALADIDFDYNAAVDVYGGIQVGIAGDINDNVDPKETPMFPNIVGTFEFYWDTDAGLSKLGFGSLSFDMGSFMSGVLGPIVSKIQKVVEPLEPLIDFLTTPFPVLKDLDIIITPLDLAKKYSKGKFDDSMIYAIKSLISLSKSISAAKSGLTLDLGNFYLVGGSGDKFDAIAFLSGKTSSTSLNDTLSTYATALQNPTSITSSASGKVGAQGWQVGDSSWDFIWKHPSDFFKYLMGQDVELVRYNMPKLSFNFDWDTFVRIWGPLGARLGVTFSASIDLSFGYDTLGIRQWISSDCKDYACLLNGFYVCDWDQDGNDINELSFYGGLTASAELNAGVKAGVGGGVGINVGFNLYDPNKDGKIRLKEFKQIVLDDGLLGLFDVNGKITACLYAYVDLWLYTKRWNITGDITLFSFNLTHSSTPVMATKNESGDVVANVGSNAGSRISTNDENETLTDGDETLNLELGEDKVYWADQKKSVEVGEGKKLIIDAGSGNDNVKLSSISGSKVKFNIEIQGGDGDDIIDLSGLTMAEGCSVFIWGGAGADHIYGANGLNIIFGDTGRIEEEKDENKKTVKYIVEANVESGTAGDDVIVGGSKQDIIIGGAGNDNIDGGSGDDVIFGDGGRVEWNNGTVGNMTRSDVSTDGGNDILVGGSGSDYLYGGSGNDHIDGGSGDDFIYGERGNDRILGGSGNDEIYGGEGYDILFGDRFDQKINLLGSFTEDSFTQEFSEIHKDVLSNDNLKMDSFTFGESKNTDDVKNFGEDKIYGGEGDDLIFGDSGSIEGMADHIEGGIGNDVIDGDGGNDTIEGGIDNDIIYGGAGDDVIDGGAGNDSLYGDAGYQAYNKAAATKFSGNQITFGDNLGIGGVIYEDVKSDKSSETGNDKIKSGPGMDFVDGQGGNDTITVSLSGGNETNYTNVTDSGTGDNESNTLIIEGTELDDTLLMRKNSSGSLGFVALLPGTENNANIERVNFTKGIQTVNLNANGGNDSITVDGTAETTNIDGGAGNDSIQVGQLYNSERTAGKNNIATEDSFNTAQIDDGRYLSDGVSKQSTLNIEGGIGADSFVSLHNVGTLNMAGGRGSDSFAVYGFEGKAEGSKIDNGVVSIDGGKGIDSLLVRGSEGADSIVASKQGLLSDFTAVKVSGVESTTLDAAGGDDVLNVTGNNAGETTILNGGKGNDTVSIGGLDADQVLKSADTDGQTNYLKYNITYADGNTDSYREKYTVLDTSEQPVVFVTKTENKIDPVDALSVKEGEICSFFISVAGNLNSGSVEVELRVPMLSTSELQSGDRGLLIAIDDGSNSIQYSESVKYTFNARNQYVKISVKALSDKLYEEEISKSISITSAWIEGPKRTTLDRSVKSVNVKVLDQSDASNITSNLLTKSQEFVVTNETKTIALGDAAEGIDASQLYIYLKGSEIILNESNDYEYDNGTHILTLKKHGFEGTLVVHYRSNEMRIDSSKINLAYDNISTLKTVKYENKLVYAKGSSGPNANANTSIYYVLNGNSLVFFNKSNDQITTLHGKLSVEFGSWLKEEDGIASQNTQNEQCSFLSIGAHSNTLAEMSSDLQLNSMLGIARFLSNRVSYTSFKVNYTGPINEGESVVVTISVEDVLRSLNKDDLAKELLIGYGGKFDTSATLTFTKTEADDPTFDGFTILVVAKHDDDKEDYGVELAKAITEYSIKEIDGAVYAYGEGSSNAVSFDQPVMLKYNHSIKDVNGYSQASIKDETNSGVGAVIRSDPQEEKDCTDRILINNRSSNVNATSTLESFTDMGLETITQDTSLEDYAKTLYKNAESSMQEDPDAVRFTHTELGSRGISMSEFEFAEFNLGSGVDTVTVSKTVNRGDDFQTYTVVNTGAGDDTVSVTDYTDDNDGQLVINAQDGDDTIKATSKNVTKDGMIVFGGADSDTIDVAKGVIAFGDKGNISSGSVTSLGYDSNGDIIYTKAGVAGEVHQLQTDGLVHADTLIKSVTPDDGAVDHITAGGTDSVVVGGNGEDDITVSGNNNVVLGDNGVVAYTGKDVDSWEDNKNVKKRLSNVATTSDADGAHDEITVTGNHNVVMGGAANDSIYIGDENSMSGGSDNVVLGDSGSAIFDTTVETSDEALITGALTSAISKSADVGDVDTITIIGGNNTVAGGYGADTINIGHADGANAAGDKNVVIGDDGTYSVDRSAGTVTVQTTDENVKDDEQAPKYKDTINIYGGQNTVMGGAGADVIDIKGDDNIVLGDGGKSVRELNGASGVYDSIRSIETTNDSYGAGDQITILGGSNAVMGGAGADTISIGKEDVVGSGNKNVVLGDGGKYEVNKAQNAVTVETHDLTVKEDEKGTYVDDIDIYGGQNTVMGGMDGDSIDIHGEDNIVLGDGGEAIREWNEETKIYDSIKTVKTTSDDNGGQDTINIHGGKNAVMGGADADTITIGDKNMDNGNTNVVLGDGGIYSTENSRVTVETTSDSIGGVDAITINGGKNIAMGGAMGDRIHINGSENVAVGDGGKYVNYGEYQTVNTKSETYGGADTITTENGKNVVLGGMDADKITTGTGNDIIVGDGGFVLLDEDRNALMVTNTDYNTAGDDALTGGADVIETAGGDNVIMGGMESDEITSGDGNDVIFGDNAYATFRGNADLINTEDSKYSEIKENLSFKDYTDVITESTLSFNFQGAAQNGLSASEEAGAAGYEATNWNNISGSLANTYGDDDKELVYFDDGTRASGISVSYAGHEYNRTTSTDKDINLQAYSLGLDGADSDSNKKLMNTGLMTTAPSNQGDNSLEVSVYGLSQYFTEYDVVVYLDVPDSHSADKQSVRRVGLWIGNVEVDAYYVNDMEGSNYQGGLKQATKENWAFQINSNGNREERTLTAETAAGIAYANYVVFHVTSAMARDRICVKITDGFTGDNINGKDLPGIAGIQIQGKHHKQDVAASTNIDLGGDDFIKSNNGDDIVVGGTGNDDITTFGDDRHGISDDDVVFGDNAKMLFTDRDSNDSTATTVSSAESIAAMNSEAAYNDVIRTGDGNDVVVGGIGADQIDAGATAQAEEKLDEVNVWSLNFTCENADASNSIAQGESAGVVVDDNWTNMFVKNGSLHTLGSSGNNSGENTFDGISATISAYRDTDWNKDYAGNYSMTNENYDELDGDAANSKLYNFYLAAQQQEEIKLSLSGITAKFDDSYDLYVYLGGDNNDTDTYNYLYQIELTYKDADGVEQKVYRYLNDWSGQTFDGDYKEAYCDDYDKALAAMSDGTTPLTEIIGNYVVFHNVAGDVADIRIKNVYASGGQNPKNLPMISAVQIVESSEVNLAIGGDHDKDLVYGDDAKLTFDLDVPYAADVQEKISSYENRVIESKAMAIDNVSSTGVEMVKTISTEDTIFTGKDRDVVVGGEGADTITTGIGDDVVLGGNANLILEHNNPVGVFTPNTEIILDQHTVNLNSNSNYLDNDNANVNEFQNRLDQHQIAGIDDTLSTENDRYDTIDAGEGRNLVSQGSWSNDALLEEPKVEPEVDPTTDGEDDEQEKTEESETSASSVTISRSPTMIEVKAGQTIKVTCYEYPQGNQWWTPNIVLYGNNAGATTIPAIKWIIDGNVTTTSSSSSIKVDLPDQPNAGDHYEFEIVAETDGVLFLYVDQG